MKRIYRSLEISILYALGAFVMLMLLAFLVWDIQGMGKSNTAMILGYCSIGCFLYVFLVWGILEGKEY